MSSAEAESLLAQTLRAQFPATAESELLSMVVGDWVPEKDRDALRVYTRAMLDEINQLIETLGHAEDEIELYNTLAFYWLELKSEWTRYNQLMNYQLFQKGQADAVVLARGSLCSSLLGRFETLLTPTDLVNLTEVAARPLEIGQPDVAQLTRFLERYARAKRVLGRVVGMADAAGAETESVKPEVQEVSSIEVSEVWPAIAARVSHEAETARPFTVAGQFGYGASIDPEWMDAIVAAVCVYVQRVCNVDVTATPEERIAAGDTAHIAFSVRGEFDSEQPAVHISWAGGPDAERIPIEIPATA